LQLAKWIAELPRASQAVAAFQLANEPVLGAGDVMDSAINAFYRRSLQAARSKMPSMPLLLSYMGPTPGALTFLKEAKRGSGDVIVDHHYYLNWQAPAGVPMPWPEIYRRACLGEAEGAVHNLDVYSENKQDVIVGEWSLAVNYDQEMDLTDETAIKQLTKLYRIQMQHFKAHAAVRGSFFWTLRMGSGWDPRPTDAHPHGRQVEGSSASKSLPGYPFTVWSLLELAEAGIATPLNESWKGECDDVDLGR